MDRFTIAPDIATLLPTMRVVIVVAYNLTNTGTNAVLTKFAEVSLQAKSTRSITTTTITTTN